MTYKAAPRRPTPPVEKARAVAAASGAAAEQSSAGACAAASAAEIIAVDENSSAADQTLAANAAVAAAVAKSMPLHVADASNSSPVLQQTLEMFAQQFFSGIPRTLPHPISIVFQGMPFQLPESQARATSVTGDERT